MIRYDVDIRLAETDAASAREAVEAHHRLQPYTGDFFMAGRQLDARHLAIAVDGQRVGVAAVNDDSLSLCTIDTAATRYDRQMLNPCWPRPARPRRTPRPGTGTMSICSGASPAASTTRPISSNLFGDAVAEPLPGLSLTKADKSDLDYLESTGFLEDNAGMVAKGELRVARRDEAEVGIGVVASQRLANGRDDIGMFTEPGARRAGIGRSILALAAREVLAAGRTPAAGCWWRNWESRRTLEAVGMTRVGTIFRFDLDPDRFEQC